MQRNKLHGDKRKLAGNHCSGDANTYRRWKSAIPKITGDTDKNLHVELMIPNIISDSTADLIANIASLQVCRQILNCIIGDKIIWLDFPTSWTVEGMVGMNMPRNGYWTLRGSLRILSPSLRHIGELPLKSHEDVKMDMDIRECLGLALPMPWFSSRGMGTCACQVKRRL